MEGKPGVTAFIATEKCYINPDIGKYRYKNLHEWYTKEQYNICKCLYAYPSYIRWKLASIYLILIGFQHKKILALYILE